MAIVKRQLRLGFAWLEALFDRIFSPAWNPLYHLGALGFFYYWIVAATGIYIYIFFDTGITEAYDSLETITYEHFYIGGVMRSLHRYASDGMVAMMMVHMLREFCTGPLPRRALVHLADRPAVLWMVYAAGVSGYWLVWDKLAQYIAIVTTEWLDWLPIIGGTIARNFLDPAHLDDRFFTLMVFMHIFVPLFLLFVLWIHLLRVTSPSIHPPRGLAAGTLAMMLVLSLVKPAVSQAPADLALVPSQVGLDWFYLPAYPLTDILGYGALWGLVALSTLLFVLLPWLPPMRRTKENAAVVDLANCNGCTRCAEDCPSPRSTCARAATAAPSRARPWSTRTLCRLRHLRRLLPHRHALPQGQRADPGHRSAGGDGGEFARPGRCRSQNSHGESAGNRFLLASPATTRRDWTLGKATIQIPCAGMLPPSFIDYVLSRNLGGWRDAVWLQRGRMP